MAETIEQERADIIKWAENVSTDIPTDDDLRAPGKFEGLGEDARLAWAMRTISLLGLPEEMSDDESTIRIGRFIMREDSQGFVSVEHFTTIEDAEECIQTRTLTEYDAEQYFVDVLNGIYGTVDIAGNEFDVGRALRELDKDAFREGMLKWANCQGIEIE